MTYYHAVLSYGGRCIAERLYSCYIQHFAMFGHASSIKADRWQFWFRLVLESGSSAVPACTVLREILLSTTKAVFEERMKRK